MGDDRFPKIMQDGRDGDKEPGYIGNMKDSATAGFKYFDCKNVTRIRSEERRVGKECGAQPGTARHWPGFPFSIPMFGKSTVLLCTFLTESSPFT